EKYDKNNLDVLKSVFRFLGVSDFVPTDMRRKNSAKDHYFGKEENDIPIFDSGLRDRMKEYFELDICELRKLVNFDVAKWLQ
ncbi:MAG: hypothetical protein OEQ39_22845, partial [Gammaproteobacteria bacterium]|nr:hypothetical protein [Gammaproteobacteria bacterium]